MINITFNNQIYEIDDDLTKLSEYIKLLHNEDPYEPLPLLKCNDKIYEIFRIWFNELKKVGIVEIPKNFSGDYLCLNDAFVFKFKMFMGYDVETLYQLLDFSFMNQIFLLFETIALTIATKYENEEFEIKQIDENFYMMDNIKISKFYINIINNKNEKLFKVNQEEIDQLNKEKEILDEKRDELRNKIKGVESEIEKLKEQKEELEEQTYYIKCSINELKEQKRAIEKEIDELEEQKEDINDGIEDLDETAYTYEYSPESVENLINNFEKTTVIYPNELSDYKYKKSKSIAFLIPNGPTKIGECCFNQCSNLKFISLSETIEEIGKYAFSECLNLENITISESVREIGNYAFNKCSNLKSLTFAKATSLTFAKATSLMSAKATSISTECRQTKGFNIPKGLTKIGDCAFSECSNLKNITIPDSVKEIGNYAFSKCSNLENITIPEGITKIGNYTFSKCSNLENVVIPKSVKEIGKNAFYISNEDYTERKITMPKRFYERRKEIFNNVDNIEFILTNE